MKDFGFYYMFGSHDGDFIPSLFLIERLFEIIVLEFLNNVSSDSSSYMTQHSADARAVAVCPTSHPRQNFLSYQSSKDETPFA
ncbi:hypothetical protein BT93_A0194 [Corymbia citriodora subsp. variegata]|nr:hypothetical protein BT93_A0194 [Corymbia citriodora subsp. variegata]